MTPLVLLLWLAAPVEDRPLFYWGSRAAVVRAEGLTAQAGDVTATEVHAALDGADLVLRFTFTRAVRAGLYLPDGSPVSGRLRAVLYLDGDDDRASGLDEGPRSLRTGADRRIEIGVLSLGEDVDEKRAASAVVTATLAALARDGRRRTLWRGDDAAEPTRVSAHGECVELRLPAARAELGSSPRLILVDGERAWDGRLR